MKFKKTKNNVYLFKWGGGFLSTLTFFFVICKVFGLGLVANWSWWKVFSPLWGPIAAVLVIFFGGLVIVFLYNCVFYYFEERKRKKRVQERRKKHEESIRLNREYLAQHSKDVEIANRIAKNSRYGK